jgi:hypothetical protein
MKSIIENVKTMGANDKTINFMLVCFIAFLSVIGTGSIVVAFILVLEGRTPPNWLTAVISGIVGVAGVLITAQHTTNSINGTAAQTASATATSVVEATQPSIVQSNATSAANAELVKTVLEVLSGMQATSQTATAQNTAAVQDNTRATDEATVSQTTISGAGISRKTLPTFDPHSAKG